MFNEFDKGIALSDFAFLPGVFSRRAVMSDALRCEGSTTLGSQSELRPEAVGQQQGKAFLIRVFDALGEWQDRSATRRRLAALDNRMLRDIGIDRATAAAESAKPFWQS